MNQRGFTLIEMIIGITLLGFILVLLYGGLRLSVKSWDTGEAMVSGTSRQVAVSNFLRRQLAQIYPLTWTDRDGKTQVAFSGDPDAVYFAAPIQAALGPGGISLLALRAEPADDGNDLSLSWQRNDPQEPAFEFPNPDDKVALAKKLDKIVFAYFGTETPDDEPAWHDEWHSESVLPQMIRLSLAGKDGRVWPDIVVVIQQGSGCSWNAITRQCI